MYVYTIITSLRCLWSYSIIPPEERRQEECEKKSGAGILIGVKLTLVGSPLLYSDSLTESG